MVSRKKPSPTDAPRLAGRTSMRVGGRPDAFYEPESADAVREVLCALHASATPVRVLGGGCNILVGDGRVPGAVLSTRLLRDFRVLPDWVEVGAGYSFPRLVREAIDLRIPGLPGCPGIPGSVGGVVRMNAGGRFGSAGDALIGVRGFHLDGTPFEHRVSAGDVGYRTSIFKDRVVVEAIFRRVPSLARDDLQARYDEAWAWKRQTQPMQEPSAGCMFKKPGRRPLCRPTH